jgi:hypothetical protein
MQWSKNSHIPYFGIEVSSERKINDESNTRIQNIYTFYQITKEILYNRNIQKLFKTTINKACFKLIITYHVKAWRKKKKRNKGKSQING